MARKIAITTSRIADREAAGRVPARLVGEVRHRHAEQREREPISAPVSSSSTTGSSGDFVSRM